MICQTCPKEGLPRSLEGGFSVCLFWGGHPESPSPRVCFLLFSFVFDCFRLISIVRFVWSRLCSCILFVLFVCCSSCLVATAPGRWVLSLFVFGVTRDM